MKFSGRKHISVVRRGKDQTLARGSGEAVENEKEVFTGKLDNECKTVVELVGTNKYSNQSGWRSSFGHQDGCPARGVLGNDVIGIWMDDG